MAGFQRTDPACWMDEHGDALYRFAVTHVGDRPDAEDLVQETLLAALQARHRFAGRSSERTWFIGILKHKIADHYRAVGYEVVVPWPGEAAGRPASRGADPAEVLERKEFWWVLRACLAELSPRLACAFWMREVDGLPSEEICRRLGVTTGNLWVMQHRARAQLRRRLRRTWYS